jgi:hypothetical protein
MHIHSVWELKQHLPIQANPEAISYIYTAEFYLLEYNGV